MTDLNNKLSKAWEGFAAGDWQKEVNVRDFIQKTTLPMKATKLSWRAPFCRHDVAVEKSVGRD